MSFASGMKRGEWLMWQMVVLPQQAGEMGQQEPHEVQQREDRWRANHLGSRLAEKGPGFLVDTKATRSHQTPWQQRIAAVFWAAVSRALQAS